MTESNKFQALFTDLLNQFEPNSFLFVAHKVLSLAYDITSFDAATFVPQTNVESTISALNKQYSEFCGPLLPLENIKLISLIVNVFVELAMGYAGNRTFVLGLTQQFVSLENFGDLMIDKILPYLRKYPPSFGVVDQLYYNCHFYTEAWAKDF